MHFLSGQITAYLGETLLQFPKPLDKSIFHDNPCFQCTLTLRLKTWSSPVMNAGGKMRAASYRQVNVHHAYRTCEHAFMRGLHACSIRR